VHEQAQIISAYCDDLQPQKEVALQYRVAPALVGSLVKRQQLDPFYLSKRLEKMWTAFAETEAVETAVAEMQKSRLEITSARQVQEQIQKKVGQEVAIHKIRAAMRGKLGMSYRTAKKVPKQGNSERCLVLRQQYALKMLPLLEAPKRIINVDESWINETGFFRKLWQSKTESCSAPARIVSPRLSLLAAIDTEGNIWFALTQANTDSDVLLLFFLSLLERLDREAPSWREDTIFLLDGARYHTSAGTRAHFEQMRLQVIYTAPYCYESSPIERLFAALKLGELNPAREPTGKR